MLILSSNSILKSHFSNTFQMWKIPKTRSHKMRIELTMTFRILVINKLIHRGFRFMFELKSSPYINWSQN